MLHQLTLAALLVLSSHAFAAAPASNDAMKFGGFVDAQYHWTNLNSQSQGFVIHDGALKFEKSDGATTAEAKLKFNCAGSSSPQCSFATDSSTFVISHNYDNGWRWRAGRVGTPWGYESSDSSEYQFSRAGILSGRMSLPTAMHALETCYDISKTLWAMLIVGNRVDTATQAGNPLDVGGQLKITATDFYIQPGVLITSKSGETLPLFDVYGGVTLGKWTVDYGFDLKRAFVSDPVTTGIEKKYVYGALGNISYCASEKATLGTRAEYMTGIHTTTGEYTKGVNWQLTFGPQYQMSKNLKLKLDVSEQAQKADNVGSTSFSTTAGLAFVYKL